MARYTLEGTRFIFDTNFEGNPEKGMQGSTERAGNIIIPKDMADELLKLGVNVKETKPREGDGDDFEPEYFVKVKLSFDSPWPPKINLRNLRGELVQLDDENVVIIDDLVHDRAVSEVDIVFTTYRGKNSQWTTLWIQNMYVIQDVGRDPFAAKYFG